MKTVYYITAPTCSGKTTMALRLGRRMELPVYHADTVYEMLQSRHQLSVPADRLFDPEEVERLHLDFGDYKNIVDAKRPLYAELITRKSGDFIIEGYSLSFADDRRLVSEAVGAHRSVILRINLPFEKWKHQYSLKMGQSGDHLLQAYERINSFFSAREGDVVYEFQDANAVDQHYSPYQKAGFTDKKIEALRIPILSGDVVNDIGCNEGLIGQWCLQHGAKHVRGYDANWRFLDRAAQNNLEVYLGDIESNNLKTADVNLCVSVFHYFKNPQGFLAKVKAATGRLLVLEIPIYEEKGLLAKFEPANDTTKYSTDLIELWLKRNFPTVERVGRSVSPDGSFRLVYHCHV